MSNNYSGYPGYPHEQHPNNGGSGYPPQSQSGYGGSSCYAPNSGFARSAPYTGNDAFYPGSNAPYPHGSRGAPYSSGCGGAPYPHGSNNGGLGFKLSQPHNAYSTGPDVYSAQTTYNYKRFSSGYLVERELPYGQQSGHGCVAPPYQQPHNPSVYGHRPATFAMTASRPTIYANQNFNANASAELLHKAMKGFGCDKNKIIQALCTINNWQRQEVARAFKSMYGKDLISSLKSELSGDFEELILALMEPPAHYDARQLHDAMAGLGTKESVLIEIMTTRSNAQINTIKQTYEWLYGRKLERDITGDTSGHFKRLLVSLYMAMRDESNHVDSLKANQDARSLYRAGEQKLGTDESTFNTILTKQNHAQLRVVFDEYQKISGHTIEQALQKEFNGDLLAALMAIVKCIRNRSAYFAELLHNSMKGFGTRDADLIRLVVSRSEIDLADIRDAYQHQYNQPLDKAIASDCSGAYKDGLIMLIKGN